jgi:hypothetical protein
MIDGTIDSPANQWVSVRVVDNIGQKHTFTQDGEGYEGFTFGNSLDYDNDGVINPEDEDDDNDGVIDSQDAFPLNPAEQLDTDLDGIGNNEDTDDDGDGIPDEDEPLSNTHPLLADTDNDGLDDGDELSLGTDPTIADSDGDGVSDGVEVDLDTDPLNPADKPQFATRYDQNGDGKADIIWRSEVSGQNWYYGMNGHLIAESKPVNIVNSPWRMIGRGDFNGDGMGDMLWRNDTTGQNYMYLMNGNAIDSGNVVNVVGANSGWDIKSIGDYNGDGNDDMIWRNANTGAIWQYQMNGFTIISSKQVTSIADANWQIIGSPDLNGDGKSDVLLRNSSTGVVWKYIMNGHLIAQSQQLMAANTDWQLVITGDFDGDNDADLLWRNTNDGRNYVYLLDTGVVNWNARGLLSQFADQNWQAVMAGDFDGDGDDDIFWRHFGDGRNYMYLMDGTSYVGKLVNTVADLTWQPIN